MAETVAGKSFDQYLPPRASGMGAFDSAATSTTSGATNLWTNLGNPGGKCMVEFENPDATNSIFILLHPSNAATTTANNGYKLTPGAHVRFWVNPKVDLFVEHLSSAGTPTLKWRVAGPIYDRFHQ